MKQRTPNLTVVQTGLLERLVTHSDWTKLQMSCKAASNATPTSQTSEIKSLRRPVFCPLKPDFVASVKGSRISNIATGVATLLAR